MSKFLQVYVDACRCTMNLNLHTIEGWKNLSTCLIAARHALMCCVCGHLLEMPMGPEPSTCQHFVCGSCVGGKTKFMKGGCGWCKNFNEFVPNVHLSMVVKCFKKLCVYISGFLSLSIRNCTELDAVVAIVTDAVARSGDEKLCSLPLYIDTSQTKSQSQLEPHIESETVTKLSSTSDVSSKSSKRCSNDSSVEPSHKRMKSAKVEVGLCEKVENADGHVQASFSRDSAGTAFDNGEIDSPLLNWSSFQLDSAGHVADQHHMVEDVLLQSSYDPPHVLLLENSVLAEHDYNKFTTECSPLISTTPVETVVTHSTSAKLPRRSQSLKKLPVKKPADYSGGSVRKSSLTIRQISEQRDQQSPVTARKIPLIATGAEVAAEKPSLPRRPKSGVVKVKVGCRCAMATPAPGKLTCCGQRCPCYAAFHGCSDSCKCRGCRNPRGDPMHPLPCLNAAVALKAPPMSDLQASMPLLFDTTGAVFGSAAHDQQQPQHMLLHARSRFSAEPISCFSSG